MRSTFIYALMHLYRVELYPYRYNLLLITIVNRDAEVSAHFHRVFFFLFRDKSPNGLLKLFRQACSENCLFCIPSHNISQEAFCGFLCVGGFGFARDVFQWRLQEGRAGRSSHTKNVAAFKGRLQTHKVYSIKNWLRLLATWGKALSYASCLIESILYTDYREGWFNFLAAAQTPSKSSIELS